MSNTAEQEIGFLISAWREEYNAIKDVLLVKGDKADLLEYNIRSTEAMTLLECINGLMALRIDFLKSAAANKGG